MPENILVCGNGPSCKEIDYTRVPEDVKVMRLTSFYFEEKYYAGKRVDYYVDYAKRLAESYFNMRMIHNKNEYDFDLENIWFTVLPEENPHFPAVKSCTDFIQQTPLIAEFRCFYEFYYRQYLPTGMQALALAFCLGYKNVYATGFDFFSDKNNIHSYPDGMARREAIKKAKPVSSFDTGSNYESEDSFYHHLHKVHPTQMQVDFVYLLKKIFPQTNLFSVCQGSAINEHIPLAPQLSGTPWFSVTDKPEDRTTDWYPLPDTMPEK